MKLGTLVAFLGFAFVITPLGAQTAAAPDREALSAKALFYNAGGSLTGVSTSGTRAETVATPELAPVKSGSVADGKPKVAANKAPPRLLALRATVLLVADGGGTREVKPSHKFKSSDRIKVAFTSSRTGYFYLATVGTSGKVQMLAPRANETAVLERGNRYVFPANPAAFFRFDANVGKEELWAILSDEPITAVNMGHGRMAQVPVVPDRSPQNIALAGKNVSIDVSDELASKDLVYEEDTNALYASAKPAVFTTPGLVKSSVVVKLTLAHE